MAGYGSDEAFEAWLDENGYALSSGLDPAILRQRGSSYVDGLYGSRFPGVPTGGYAQERAFPRTGVTVYSDDVPSNIVPAQVEAASYYAAYYEDQNPGSLSVGITPSKQVKRTKLEGLEKEYFEPKDGGVTGATLLLSAVEGLLAPLLSDGSPAIFAV